MPPLSPIHNHHPNCAVSGAASSAAPEQRSPVESRSKMQNPSRDTSPSSNSHSRSSSARRTSFDSVKEDGTEIAQSFVDTRQNDDNDDDDNNINNNQSKDQPKSSLQPPHAHHPNQPGDFCCPCGTFLGWKHIPLAGRRQSKSFSDLRLLGSSRSRGWAWDDSPAPAPVPSVKEEPKIRQKTLAALDMMPPEILDDIISLLFLDIPPNGYTPRNVDLISCLLTCRTLHSATLGVLYRTITVPHSIIFSKALNHIRQYPSLGTIVRRLDFSHFTSVGLGRTQRMNIDIQNLTSNTLLACLGLLPNLKELLLQEHVEDDLDARVLRKIFTGIPSLRAVDFCSCSSTSFRSSFASAVTENPDLPPTMPYLKRLSLHECTSLPDDAFQALLPRLVNLTHLDVSHTQITNNTLLSISPNATITHLNIGRCTKLTGRETVEFLTNHPAVRDSLVYLNVMVDVSRHQLLGEEDVDILLPHLSSSLRSLNLGGAKISSRHMPFLIKLSEHLDELGLNSANITIEDINSFFVPPESTPNKPGWVHPELRYLDLTKNPYITQASLLNPKVCLLATPQSFPLCVIELNEKTITPLRQRNSSGWVVRDLGRRAWYVREPAPDPNGGMMMPDDGHRSWKMGARWWGMRKVPVSVGEVGGIYGHYMFKK